MYILYLLIKTQDLNLNFKTNETILNNNHFRFIHLDVPILAVKKIVFEKTS